MRHSFLLLGLVVPAALFAACGGGDDAASAGGDGGGGDDGGVANQDGTVGDGSRGDGSIAADSMPVPPAMGDPCRGTPLPAGAFYQPAGTCTRVVASNVGGLRQITFAPNGDMFGTSGAAIRLFHDANANGVFEASEITTYAATGGNGNNAHVDAAGGFLYAGSTAGVKRFPYAPGMASGGNGEDVVVGQPADGHNYHTVHVYDGYLYVHSGSAGNAVNPMSPAYDTARSLLRRFKLSSFVPGTPFAWGTGEVVVVGLRNMVGFTRNAAGRMYGVVNGLDEISYGGNNVHDDNPGEQVLSLEMGKQYGYPFCFTAQRVIANGNVVAPGTQLANPGFGPHDDAWCATNSSKPSTFLQAHSAPLDIFFFDAQPTGALPEKWRGGAFVTSHGSWDRGAATGYKVVWIPFDANGNAPMPTSTMTTTTFPYEIVFGGGDANGPQDGPWSWNGGGLGESPRPVGVAISPVDGALYISSDSGGYLYRVGIMH